MAGNLFEALRDLVMPKPVSDVQTYALQDYPQAQEVPMNGPMVPPAQSPAPMSFGMSSPTPATPSVSAASGQENAPSLFDKFNAMMSDPEKNAQIVMALNSLRGTPDQGLAAAMQKRIETANTLKVANAKAQRAVKLLRDMGKDDLAEIVASNPSLADDAMKAAAGLNKTISGVKTSEVKTDPKTGQQYVVESNPNTGEVTRINIEGAFGLTPEQKAKMEADAQIELNDRQQGFELGQRFFANVNTADNMIKKLYQARDAIVEGGAETGLVRSYLPAFDSATAELRSLANQLGIDVINSATFGALSAPELQLALSTGLPTDLSAEETVKYIDNKIKAQRKLRNELYSSARKLMTGRMKLSDYVNQYSQPGGVEILEQPAPQQQTSGSFQGFEVVN